MHQLQIQADAAYAIGAGHKVCEDYALARAEAGGLPCVVLADGCSASPGSDVGARILAHACQATIQHLPFARDLQADEKTPGARDELHAIRSILESGILRRAKIAAQELSLDSDCLDATLLCAFAWRYKLYAFVFGDGQLQIDDRDGSESYRFDYDSGAPYYLSYALDDARRSLYRERFGRNPYRVSRIRVSQGQVSRRLTIQSYEKRFALCRPLNAIRRVTLFSDGVQSFAQSDAGDGANVAEAAPERIVLRLADYKNTRGEFVQRRMQRFLREIRRQDLRHFDDLAVACLAVSS